MTEQMAIEAHIKECNRRIANIKDFMRTSSDADKSGCAINIKTLQMVVKALEEIQQYRAIGTVEELQALKEKSEPREIAEHNFQDEPHHYLCPNCRNIVNYGQKYCEECGQHLDWE